MCENKEQFYILFYNDFVVIGTVETPEIDC